MSFTYYVASTFCAKIVVVIFSFFSGIITARFLGPYDRGILAVITSIPATIYMLSSLGINQANIYFIGKKKYLIQDIISNTFFISIIVSTISILALIVFRNNILNNIFTAIKPKYFVVILLIIPFHIIKNFYEGVLRGKEKFNAINVRDLLIGIIRLIIVFVLLVLLHFRLYALIIGILAIKIIETFWQIILIKKINSIKIGINKKLAKKSFRFGIKSYLQNFLIHLHFKIDIYLLAYFLSPSDVAFYDIAVLIVELLLIIPVSIKTVLLPKLVYSSEEEKRENVLKTSRHSFFLLLIGAIPLVVMGKWMIKFVYGEEYISAYYPLLIILPGIIAASINNVIIPYFTSKNKQEITILITLPSLIVNIILNIILIPQFGICGAAFATLISYTATTILLLLVYKNKNEKIKNFLLLKKEDIHYYSDLFLKSKKKINLMVGNL